MLYIQSLHVYIEIVVKLMRSFCFEKASQMLGLSRVTLLDT